MTPGAGTMSPPIASGASDPRRPRKKGRIRRTSLFAHGEPLVWLTGGSLVLAVAMILGLLLLVLVQGARTFWPASLEEITTVDGRIVLGEVTAEETYRPAAGDVAGLSAEAQARHAARLPHRRGVRGRGTRGDLASVRGTPGRLPLPYHRAGRSGEARHRREVELEEECLKVLALHQPVAFDLRFVAACLEITGQFREMMEVCVRMLRDATDAFVKGSPELARRVCEKDDEADWANEKTVSDQLRLMHSDTERLDQRVSPLSVSKNLEHVADHATNIAEDVIYLVDGEIVRHRLATGEDARPLPR